MDTNKTRPFFKKTYGISYVKDATVPFKMQTLRDCSTTGQSAFNARILSVFWGCLYSEEMSASTFSFFLFNGSEFLLEEALI